MRRVANKIERPTRQGVKPSVYNHQLTAYQVLSRYISFVDKDVLEVGGTQSCESMYPFLRDGAASGVVTGLDHICEEQTDREYNLRVQRADALKLSAIFGPSRFDVVYGLSIVEHIPSPAVFLDEVYTVLRPGGLAYLEGNPLWSSPHGHHVWVATWGGAYQGRATANYLFSQFPGHTSTNPLPNWSHLLMSPGQMREHLANEKLPQIDIDCIIDWVFSSPEINRLALSDIAAAYGRSKLTVLEANTTRCDVPQDVLAALRERNGEGIDYGLWSVAYVLAKPR
ncbi:MAG: class I SAM-dependent methyltransferase [Isosphaeraceae bacterium]